MSYIYYNPNPLKLSVGDCTIRAISCALNMSWKRTYLSLAIQGFQMYDMPSANRVWGEYLKTKGFKRHQKDLIETEKNLGKIEYYDDKKEESHALAMPGYSQRKYYIDADYEPGRGMSYAMNSYMDGNSYARGGRTVYDIDRNSYMYMAPQHDMSYARGYSRTGTKSEMIEELHKMMNETGDETVKKAIQEAITKMGK